MQEFPCFQPYDVTVAGDSWQVWKVCQPIAFVCPVKTLDPSIEAHPVDMAIALRPCVESHLRSQMEPNDFFPIAKDLVDGKEDYWKMVTKCLAFALAIHREIGVAYETDNGFKQGFKMPYIGNWTRRVPIVGRLLKENALFRGFSIIRQGIKENEGAARHRKEQRRW